MAVLKLADKAKDHGDNGSKRVSVEQALENCLEELRARNLKTTRCVICLEHEDDEGPDYFTANCTFREALGLLEFVKLAINSSMKD